MCKCKPPHESENFEKESVSNEHVECCLFQNDLNLCCSKEKEITSVRLDTERQLAPLCPNSSLSLHLCAMICLSTFVIHDFSSLCATNKLKIHTSVLMKHLLKRQRSVMSQRNRMGYFSPTHNNPSRNLISQLAPLGSSPLHRAFQSCCKIVY